MSNFTYCVRQAHNGWIVTVVGVPGCMGEDYVFDNLDKMNAWLKAKYEA